ncbi:MAG: hypothetical protein IJF92_02105 [Bacilli bacterium]|nr:hypothetical protein [Bacilli bacterium]
MAIRIRKRLTKKEYIFNVVSLLVIISIGLYFGIRSFYYYGKQNNNSESVKTTLADKIINNNQLSNKKEGLFRDKEGYYFKGKVDNNYVKFANRYYRIIRINEDNTVKLVSEDNTSIFMWGEKSKYKGSNLNIWLNKTKDKNSGVYYDTISSINKFLVKTKYSENILSGSKIKKTKRVYKDYITTLTVDDYVKSGGSNGYLNDNKYHWLIGQDKSKMNLYINESGEVESTSNFDAYGVKAVITMNDRIVVSSGDGTKDNPYVIEQNNNTNYVDGYVKLGNDIYKVYQDKDNVLKLALSGYINNNGVEETKSFSNKDADFDLNNSFNIAYYLNTTYYNSLTYKDLLLDINNNIGEVSEDTNLSYLDIFNSKVTSKIGLLNIFDYNTLGLNDYYLINKTSSSTNMIYVYNQSGTLNEGEVTELKQVVPTISINKKIIKKGDGTKEKPFTVE